MHDRLEVYTGVFRSSSYRSAVYAGTGQALVAAGIVEQHQMPGQPGNPKTSCSITADGRRAGRGTGIYSRDVPGRKRIYAERDGYFTVYLTLSPDRIEAIEAENARASSCWPFPVVNGAIPGRRLEEARP